VDRREGRQLDVPGAEEVIAIFNDDERRDHAMTTIDITSLDAVIGGDAFGTHLGDVAGRVGNGALGNGMPDWMKPTKSMSDAGKIDEGEFQRKQQQLLQGPFGSGAPQRR
jgi:hypothetical protein